MLFKDQEKERNNLLIANLKNQLGNQMVQYAAVKSIALDKGFEFKYHRQAMEEKYINDTDKRYGNEISTLFCVPDDEKIEKIPQGMSFYNEYLYREKNRAKFYFQEALEIKDNVVMNGLFESVKYFENKREMVIEWFCFHDDIKLKMQNKINLIKLTYFNRPVISVHFRVGKDYTTHGLTMTAAYWINAAKQAMKDYQNPLFLCFYDKKNNDVEKFMKKYESIDARGSLIEDMCLISMCDAHIICNSTFSIMAAFLDRKHSRTYCPARYPSYLCYRNLEDCFLPEWVKIKGGRRSLQAGLYTLIHYGKQLFNFDGEN